MSTNKKITTKKNPSSDKQSQSQSLEDHQKASISTKKRYSGPLPSAEQMAKYDAISPTIVNRIITLAESEAVHRRSMENKVVTYQGREILAGQLFGLIVSLTGFILSAYIVYLGHPKSGVVIATGVIASLVGVFIKGRSQEKDT